MIFVVIIARILWATISSDAPETGQRATNSINKRISYSLVIPPGKNHIIRAEPANGTITTQNEVMVEGRVSDLKATVTVNNHPVHLNKEGYFSETVYLNPGKNQCIVAIEHAAKGLRNEKILSWVLDRTPPFFEINNLSLDQSLVFLKEPVQIEGQFVLLGEDGSIAIESGVEVFAGKFSLKISSDRRTFSGHLPLPDGDHKLLITAKDLAGNRYEESIMVRVGVAPLEIRLSSEPRLVKKEGMTEMLLFEGETVPGVLVVFGDRPVEVSEDGKFEFVIYSQELRDMYSRGHTKVKVRDMLGRKAEIDIPRKGDFVPPYWESLQISSRSEGEISLQGKTSKANVKVEIGGVESTSDHDGIVNVDSVPIEKGQSLVSTILIDMYGNKSHIERWVQ